MTFRPGFMQRLAYLSGRKVWSDWLKAKVERHFPTLAKEVTARKAREARQELAKRGVTR